MSRLPIVFRVSMSRWASEVWVALNSVTLLRPDLPNDIQQCYITDGREDPLLTWVNKQYAHVKLNGMVEICSYTEKLGSITHAETKCSIVTSRALLCRSMRCLPPQNPLKIW
jgi:hypothetical protein